MRWRMGLSSIIGACGFNRLAANDSSRARPLPVHNIRPYVITYAAMTTATTEALAVGARVKALREAMGLSLRDLAERSSVSAPMLSQVERGEPSPTSSTRCEGTSVTKRLGMAGWVRPHVVRDQACEMARCRRARVMPT